MYNVYNMVRTQIYLPEELHQELLTLARAKNTSLSELVRIGVKKLVKERKARDKSWKVMEKLAHYNLPGPKDLSRKHDKHYTEAVLGDRDISK
jgi:hypothetical protein